MAAPTTMSEHAEPPVVCANCSTSLQGAFCHACGQSAHDPVRSFAHALEEVFESFWHLDGRVFRTLREVLVPGRLANAYLGGRRAPYVAPMRFFVVAAVLTFFVARLAVHVDSGPAAAARFDAAASAPLGDFARAGTPAEVEALRATLVADLGRARDGMPEALSAGRAGFDAGIRTVNTQADRRLRQLRGEPATEAGTGTAAPAPVTGSLMSLHGKPWDAQTNPLQVAWLPGFGNRWVNTQLDHIQRNLPRLRDDPQLLFNAFLASVPSALFVLVPLFALLLRVAYLGSGRVYLEHLVVALYSHAFLCLDLLAVVLLSVLARALEGTLPSAGVAIGLLQGALVLAMPLYLLWMQRRVYRQSWLLTTLKYACLGTAYFSLVTLAATALMLFSLAHF